MAEEKTPSDRLDTWQSISDYLKRDIRTVARWEKKRGLPIRRVPGGQRAVFAYRHEIDQWLNSSAAIDDEPVESATAPVKAATPLVTPVVDAAYTIAGPATGHRRTLTGYVYIVTPILVVISSIFVAYLWLHPTRSPGTVQLADFKQLTANGREKDHLLLAGSHLYFGQEQDGWFALAEMAAEGGPIHTLWKPSMNVFPEDISPDGRRLLARTFQAVGFEYGVWIVPLDGGDPYPLSNLIVHSAAWSPDGRTIAYATGDKIYLMSSDGTSRRQIASFADVPDILRWSADGRRLRFVLMDAVTKRPTYWELVSSDGMVTTSLHPIPLPVAGFGDQWSRTSREDENVLFVNDGKQNKGWLMRHGHNWWEHPISMVQFNTGLGRTMAVAYNVDANRLYLIGRPPARIITVRFDPRSQEYRHILVGITAAFVDYSRDAQWITYTSPEDETLWISRSDGTERRRVDQSSSGPVELPRWSPDGKSIAYMMKRPGRPWRIFIAPRDGGISHEASEGIDNQGAPTWSPDGKFLVYGNVECQATHSCAIYRIDLATGRTQTLPESDSLATARWSPDGRYIVAMQPEKHLLLLYNVATNGWRELAQEMNGTDLSWSADSRFLYANLPGVDARIIRIAIPDGRMETVVNLRSQDDVNLAQVPDMGFSVAPDGAILLQRRMNSEEIYAYTLRQ